ncbi:UNVERIFIED_CONTAM: hypothetical protein Sradi_7107600 [Sesamum radiatum]|uniref:Uncharacterized protein n=1 Tax=Sesamum radiatum TaxID=300843 RepID=A0AAW2J153_SESRA
MNDRKRAGTHPKWLNFGGEMGHRGRALLSTPWSSERASRGYAARRVTPPVRKVKPSGSFGVPPPPIKHYSAHHSAGAIIPALTHRIPSELRSYACLGESSTRMGIPWEVLVLHPFLRTSPPFFQVFCCFFSFFFFWHALPSPTALSVRFESSRAARAHGAGLAHRNAMNDRKRAGTHPKWLNFGGEMGHKGAALLSTPWSSERASRGYAARRVTPPVRKVKPSGSFGVPPPPIKHYSAHHSAGAIIPALTHRIPSELRS